MARWIPISPYLTRDGAFVAMAGFANGVQLKPIPLSGQTEFGTFWEKGMDFSLHAAAQLGLAGAVSLKSSFTSRTIAHDIALYTERVVSQPNGFIYGTRWGAGLRVRVTVFESDSSVDLQLPAVAAAASLGMVDASYEVEGIGLTSADVLALLPPPGRFDHDTYGRIEQAMTDVFNQYLKPKANIESVPFQILVSNPETFGSPADQAKAHLFAIRCIGKGLPLDEALGGARDRRLDPCAVEEVYSEWVGAGAAPDEKHQSRAADWLNVAKTEDDWE